MLWTEIVYKNEDPFIGQISLEMWQRLDSVANTRGQNIDEKAAEAS